MKRLVLVGAIVSACACGKKPDGGSAPVSAKGSGVALGSAAPVARAAPDAAVAAAPATRFAGTPIEKLDDATLCATSGLLLVAVSFDEAGAKFCDLCKAVNASACSGKWPDDFVAPGDSASARFDQLRNTIYAAYGYPFKKARWQKLFRGAAWYKPDAKFEESSLGKVAWANVAVLRRMKNVSGMPGVSLAPGDTQKVDLDDDGTPEDIAVATDGSSVSVGGVKITAAERAPNDIDPDEAGHVSGVDVIDLDAKHKGKQLALRYAWDEDVERWEVFDVAGGKATFVGETYPGDVTGDGTVVVDSSWCGVETLTTYKLAKGKFTKAGEKKRGKEDPGNCAACPYVYVQTSRGMQLEGEILKYLSSASRAGDDALALPPDVQGGFITVEIREIERETTYLDAIQLDVDGTLVDAAGCGRACARDERYEIIEQGDTRTFRFPWSGAVPQHATLRASGFYLPH